jgi:hypothetical protein
LLVGINQYRPAPLSGCVTDVELQRELLQARYGFQPSDILTLVDQQATREAIVTAFTTHLIEQAKTGDVVVVHFSGYGGMIAQAATPQPSLVTVDEPVTTGDGLMVRDLSAAAFDALLRSLATENVTTVLDTSYRYPGRSLQGNLRIRARPLAEMAQLQPTELDLKLLDEAADPSSAKSARLPGVRWLATAADQVATETRWSGFSAGLFTYALTQHLWQLTPPTTLYLSLGRVREQVEQWATQAQPQLVLPNGSLLKSQPLGQIAKLMPYDRSPLPLTAVDGVITSLEDGGTVRLWLGGLSPLLLEHYGLNSLLTIVPALPSESPTASPQDAPIQVQLLSRDGLSAKAKRVPSPKRPIGETSQTPLEALIAPVPEIQVGQFVQEQVRVVPRHVDLTVALDSSLERIERVDAISAFSAIPHVTAAIAGEQAADYLFSKAQTTVPTQVAALPSSDIPLGTTTTAQSSYGLFSPGQTTLPSTIGAGGEAVKVAVRRLAPILPTLIATKLLNLTVNETVSQLAVRAVLEAVDAQPQVLVSRETRAAARRSLPPLPQPQGLVTLPVGTRIQYRLENHSAQPVFVLVLGRDSGGTLMSLYAPGARSREVPPTDALDAIAPAANLTLPPATSTFQWVLHSPTGISETYLICSRAPFTQTLMTLDAVLRPVTDFPMLYTIPNPVEVAQSVLQDLQQAGASATQTIAAADSVALDIAAWATVRFVYQVV